MKKEYGLEELEMLEMLVLLKREILLFVNLTLVTNQWNESRPCNADCQSYTHLSDGRAILLGGLKMLKGLEE